MIAGSGNRTTAKGAKEAKEVGKNFDHRDGMNKVQVLRRYAPGVGIWGRQVAGCARAVRQYDLDTEISQTCGSKRHRKAGMSLNGSVVIA